MAGGRLLTFKRHGELYDYGEIKVSYFIAIFINAHVFIINNNDTYVWRCEVVSKGGVSTITSYFKHN